MPTYEMVLLLRKLPIPQLKSAMKRTATYVLETGGVLRSMENLGLKQCPYKMRSSRGKQKEANYFLYTFDASQQKLPELSDKIKKDVDAIRQRIFFKEDRLKINLKEKVEECDIHLDLLDVPFRPHVQKMAELSKKKRYFKYGGGRSYDPLRA